MWEALAKDLASKHVGYNGEEVSKCYPLTLDKSNSSLPYLQSLHGGCIEATDWLGPRSKEFLLHPERCLLDDSEIPELEVTWKSPCQSRRRKIPLAKELVRRGVCRWIPYSAVHVVKGRKLLNGLFGVQKPARLASGEPVLRVIMNLGTLKRLFKAAPGGHRSSAEHLQLAGSSARRR